MAIQKVKHQISKGMCVIGLISMILAEISAQLHLKCTDGWPFFFCATLRREYFVLSDKSTLPHETFTFQAVSCTHPWKLEPSTFTNYMVHADNKSPVVGQWIMNVSYLNMHRCYSKYKQKHYICIAREQTHVTMTIYI